MTAPKNLFLFLAGFFLLFIQIHPLLPFGKDGGRPDLLLLFTIILGIHFTWLPGAVVCFLVGYLVEIFSGANSGFFSIVYFNIFIVIKMLQRYLIFDTLAKVFLLLILCICIKYFLLLFSFCFIYEYCTEMMKRIFFKETLYTVILSPVVFSLLIKTMSYRSKRPFY